MNSHKILSFFFLFTILPLINNTSIVFSQDKDFSGTKIIQQDGKVAIETIPVKNSGPIEFLDDHLLGFNNTDGSKFVLGGSVIWSTQDPVAIANVVAINSVGNSALTGWGLNSMRATLYTDLNSTPKWDFPTGQYDPFVDISGDGSKIAVTAGTQFYLLNPANGNIDFQFDLPDSLYASSVAISRDGSMAVLLAQAWGNSTTYRAYAFDIDGSPTIEWMFDVQGSEILNWAGVNFSADGFKVAITGRNHLYIFNSLDGSLIWDHFVDNTESAPAISGDGKVVSTADNSGFVQAWQFDQSSNEYFLLWQYRVPVGAFSNWASSVGISADASTIVAGSLIFLTSGYEGSVMCFDTYGNGTPKWVFSGAGDLVDDIKLSDDGKVVAAVTWGDYPAHSRPDLMVFDTQTGALTFNVVTPGSFFTCDLSPDGKRVIAGGKAVHAREFGNGGRIYLCSIELGGGSVTGNVNLTDTGDDSGVLVKATGTSRGALTDQSGNYTIDNIPAGTYTITAEKPGYNFGSVTNVNVSEGVITSGVDFTLNVFPAQAPVLSATQNEVGEINLSWILPPEFSSAQRKIEMAKAVGDLYPKEANENTKSISDKYQDDKSLELNSFSDSFLLADSVFVYRSQIQGGPYSKIGSVSLSEPTYTDTDVFPLREYYYVVNIVTDIGQSQYSNEAIGQVSDTLLTFSIEVPQASIPTIDGILSPGEWDDAFLLDISDIFGYGGGVPIPQGSVHMYLKFDETNNMLYIAGEDFLNPTLDDNEGFGLYFDDNNNNLYNSNPPFIQEGNFWAYWHPGGANLRFRDLVSYVVDTLFYAEVEFSASSGHLQGEVAIPMGFLDGYQLQVFGPDKIVGLGAFLIARNAGAAVFNGWWPQTMNTVFNPQYFGDVNINVSLDSPPQAPSNISVTRQGQDLLLTWDDPTLGLNNDPLSVPPTIMVYKNGEFLTTFSAGVETYTDDQVYCVAWYEYQLQALIVIGSDTLTGPMSAVYGNYACEEPTLVPISYDDDEWDGFYVVDFDSIGCKFAVRFTPESYPATVRRLVTTTNSNDDFDYTVHRDDGGVPGVTIAGPYRVYGSNPPGTVSIVTKNLPGIDPPEIMSGDFWIVINWLEDTPGSPGIGVDVDPPNSNRSIYYMRSTGWQSFTVGNIMVTAYVSDQAVDVDDQVNNRLPITFDLEQNYPNPFNPSTVISYQIPQNEMVSLEIYNALGERVRTLVNEVQNEGKYEITWNGKNNSGIQLPSGMYLYRLTAGSNVKTMKMILLK